jgi:hypothetical protein
VALPELWEYHRPCDYAASPCGDERTCEIEAAVVGSQPRTFQFVRFRMTPSAIMPFRFVSCMELREVLGKRAMDEHRLLELIEEVPADSIYYHTHSYYLRHAYTQQLYSNDFATWLGLYAQDRILGERLGVLDSFEFSNIDDLRTEIVTVMADHLSHSTGMSRFVVSEPFEFIRSHIIEISLNVETRTLREFRDALAEVEVGAVYNHVCEARMRKKPLSVDFSCWLASEDGLGLKELAWKVERVGHLGLNLEGIRKKILHLCDEEISKQRML